MRFDISMLVSLAPRPQLYGVCNSSANRIFYILRRPRHRQHRTVRFASSRVNGVYNIPVGSNGHVSLSVVQPKLLPSASRPGNVIIRLPSGPLFRRPGSEGADISFPESSEDRAISVSHIADETASAGELADITSSTVVTINYRLGELMVPDDSPTSESNNSDSQLKKVLYRYPTPVHDTLTGFDWVLEALQPNRIGVLGSHIGGSLALMLALTEPRYVHAVAALEPVCDWTSLDEFCISSSTSFNIINASTRRKPHHAPKGLVPLLEARERFFATPERYFDSFASPILFLRSAGKDVPKAWPRYLTGPEYPIPLLTRESEESLDGEVELWDAYLPEDSGYESADEGSGSESPADEQEQDQDQRPVRRRKALSRWPPYGLDYGTSGPRQAWSREPVKKLEITLPWVRVFTQQSLYHDNIIPSGSEGVMGPGEHRHDEEETHKSPARRRRNQNATVLTRQANEMVDVMRRACFWGRESGFANERVTLFSLDSSTLGTRSDSGGSNDEIVSHAGEWLGKTLSADPNSNNTDA
ncbi:hypothetical protein BJY01DRAFT_28767 [Aspergillus pseudoustus]|uniref:Alpha/beta hydrolase fold-3 domain-containing protein n=1 Tax=Aspergillus pseudoustus TaxID=1810923 RepID=A0ABR4JGL1_9EURO